VVLVVGPEVSYEAAEQRPGVVVLVVGPEVSYEAAEQRPGVSGLFPEAVSALAAAAEPEVVSEAAEPEVASEADGLYPGMVLVAVEPAAVSVIVLVPGAVSGAEFEVSESGVVSVADVA
jgi:hypothetical protein